MAPPPVGRPSEKPVLRQQGILYLHGRGLLLRREDCGGGAHEAAAEAPDGAQAV